MGVLRRQALQHPPSRHHHRLHWQSRQVINQPTNQALDITVKSIHMRQASNIISIDSVVARALNGEIVVSLVLEDASRYASNTTGEMTINADIWYSAKTHAYDKDDRVIEIGKKRYNVDELRRRLETLKGKGPVRIMIANGKLEHLAGELI